jgi:hypothetical protein
MLYNDNRKIFAYDSPSTLLNTMKEQQFQDTKGQSDRNMKFKL